MPTCIELFAGAGGLALGLKQAGFEHLLLVERDPRIAGTLVRNGFETAQAADVGAIDFGVWRDRVDLLCGGPPCQPFSRGGLGRGAEDTRNGWELALDAVETIRPRALLFENVSSLLAPRYEAYLAEYPRESRSHLARVRHVQSLVRSDQPELAVQFVDAYSKYPVAHQRELVKAEALAAMGKQDEAASLMRSWLLDPQNQALDPRTQDEGRRLLEKIERINALAPEFETFTYDGEPVSMDQFKGKVLLVDFWKSTCNPCMSELPQIADLYDVYHKDGFEVFAVNMDTDSAKMEDAIEIIGADWPVYHDGMAFNGEIAQLFDVYRTPTTILIDRDGKVRAFDQRFESIKAMVPKLLKESASN